MAFYPAGLAFGALLTSNMTDRAKAAQISMLGGLLGRNLPAVALLAAAAAQEGRTPTTGTTTGTTTTTTLDPGMVEVPDLDDADQKKAERLLTSRGLVAVASPVESDNPVDSVMGSEPPAGEIVPRGSTVNIWVSAGLKVPKVDGKPAEEAQATLEAAGWVAQVRDSEKAGKAGVVERQEPEGDSFADSTTTVTLYVFPKPATLRPADSEPIPE